MTTKKHEPTEETRKTVSMMAAAGINMTSIARCVGVHENTLRKYYSEELATGLDKANKEVAQTLFEKAVSKDMTGPSVTAAIFWLKTRARWRETTEVDLTNSDKSLTNIAWKVIDAPKEEKT